MPNYEYECKKCGRFEIFQKMSDPKLEICPDCGGEVTRLIGPGAGIVFKGSGFYQTDYRSESYKKEAKSEQKGDATPAGGGEAKGGKEPPPKAKPEPGGDKPAGSGSRSSAKPSKPSGKPSESRPGSGGRSAPADQA